MNRSIIKNLPLFLLLIALPWNMMAQKRRAMETPSTVVYALPQTVLKIDVVAEKTILRRGPFADYTEKYLGITDMVNSDGVAWKLKSVQLDAVGEVDPEQYHKITTSVNYEPGLIALTPEGLIRGFNLQNTKEEKKTENVFTVSGEDIDIQYGEFSIDPILKYREDTIYKVVETDTAFVKVPVLEKQAITKSLEEKAAEAAHQIFKLRKRRFKILTANFEVLPPDGKAYQIIVDELAKLEQEYLSLFIGKKVSSRKCFQFSYTPKKGEKGGIVFRMSPKSGPVKVDDLAGRPIRVDFKNLNLTNELVLLSSAGEQPQKQIYYRIPGMADVTISNGKGILFSKRMGIAQFGKIASMPAEVLLNENYGIEFYPNLGSIKNISK